MLLLLRFSVVEMLRQETTVHRLCMQETAHFTGFRGAIYYFNWGPLFTSPEHAMLRAQKSSRTKYLGVHDELDFISMYVNVDVIVSVSVLALLCRTFCFFVGRTSIQTILIYLFLAILSLSFTCCFFFFHFRQTNSPRRQRCRRR